MKKVLLILAVLSFAVACNKEEENTPKSKEPMISKIEVDFGMKDISDDVKNYFDITYNYVDFMGNKQTRSITDTTHIVFSIDNPDLVDENSTPINFTIEVLTTEKAGTTPKAEGLYYNSTCIYDIRVKGQYVDKNIEEFKYCCISQGSQMLKAKYDIFSTALKNLTTEKSTLKMFLAKNQDGNLRLKIEEVK